MSKNRYRKNSLSISTLGTRIHGTLPQTYAPLFPSRIVGNVPSSRSQGNHRIA